MTGEGGLSVGVHGLSLTSFTAMFGVVTTRIVMWTRWWTTIGFVFYSIFSMCAYILYIWTASFFGLSEEISWTLEPLHRAPIFWLTILLVVGTTFVAEVGMEYWRLTYRTNGSDWIRMLMKEKKGDGWNDLEKEVVITDEDLKRIEEFMRPIH